MDKIKIFAVDDEPLQLEMLKDHLGNFKNFEIKTFNTGEEMLKCLNEKPDIVVLDYNLNSVNKEAMEGVEILEELKKIDDKIEVIMFSGQDNIEVAVNTMRYGAFDYVVKSPASFHRMENIILRIIRHRNNMNELKRYRMMIKVLSYLLIIIIAFAIIAKLSGWTKNLGWM